MRVSTGIRPLSAWDYRGKRVLLRLDINSPIDPVTKKIRSENRINMSLPTIKYLLENGAKVAIIAHQGDTLDYFNLIPLEEHAQKLSQKLGREVKYIDDVCGPAALEAVRSLQEGELVLLGNLRYLTEEVSTFENDVKLAPEDMGSTWLIRTLAPLFDIYINDAFSAAHRNCPSMTGFQEVLPTAGGILMMNEIQALTRVMEQPEKPSVFVLGGLKISDAFGMMKTVLENGSCDKILAGGVTGHIFLIAAGVDIGAANMRFIKDRSLDVFIKPARKYLGKFADKIIYPIDLAYEKEGKRVEVDADEVPSDVMTGDIGGKTIAIFARELAEAGTIFVNGPAGIYEKQVFEAGTKALWNAIADAPGYSVIGGGDTVSAAQKFIDIKKIDYVCTAGGAMVNFLSGKEMPLIKAMKKAFLK